MNFNIFQTGNPMSGGWRFPYERQTSVDQLYKPLGIDSEFLKRVAGIEPKKGLLDQAVEAKPITGLLESPGAEGRDIGPLGAPGQTTATESPGGNPAVQTSPGGLSLGYDGKKGGIGLATGGLLGLLGGVTVTPQAPVLDLALPGLNGYGIADQGYGASPNAMGAPTASQAQALADALAASLSAYDSGGLLGNPGDGYGGFGGMDTSGGYGNNGGF